MLASSVMPPMLEPGSGAVMYDLDNMREVGEVSY